MTPSKTAAWRTGCHVQTLFALSFLLLTLSASASDDVWVRIHHSATDPAVASFNLQGSLSDYGNMQWGRISARQAAELEAAGVRVSIESNPFILDLGGERFDPVDAAEHFAGRQANPAGDFHLIQFDGPIRPEWLRSLRSSGLQLVQPLHPFSYIAWADNRQIATARSQAHVRQTLAMQAEWKLQTDLHPEQSGRIDTMAMASAHVDQRALHAELSRYGQVHAMTELNRHFVIVHMEIDEADFARVANMGAIYTVQSIAPDPGPRGEMSNQSIVGNIDGSGMVFPGYVQWLADTGYDGAGVTVSIVDGGIRTSHVDLADRMVPCVPSGDNPNSCTTANDSHGTHVAGAVAGTGATGTTLNGFVRGQGVAPGANLVQQRYGAFLQTSGPGGMVPDGMLKIFRETALSGALLANNSWGPGGSPRGYDIPTQHIDYISRDADPNTPGHQPVLAVWSIMNGNGDSGGTCAPSSLGSPDEAKNLFAVGSNSLLTGSAGTQAANIFRVSPNSAHGPACDGRLVPHIVAPGCTTDSTTSSSDTAHSATSCGTSMASPVVSGAVAVWTEKYIDQTGTNPSPALVKAVFTAAAQDLVGNPNADGGTMGHRPDRFQGYGRLDLDLVMNHGVEVFTIDQEEVFTATGQDWSIGLNAVDPAEPIRIMLAWTDAPGHGMGGSTPAWVNNLDLVVEADGNTYLGNVIGSGGWSATGGSADDRNNLEGVFLSPAQHGGAVNVTVSATDIVGDALDPWNPGDPSQDFALACYNCIVGDPTFSLSIDPALVEACVPDAGSADFPVNVNVGNIGVYSGTVALSVPNAPAGITNSFVPASVSVPGSSAWTLTVNAGTPADTYAVTVSGDDGSEVRTRDLSLVLDAPLNDGPTLATPANGASDTSLTPTFSWAEIAGVETYRIQVATDAGFGSIVIDEAVMAANFTPTNEFATGTEYFWRVLGSNLCGEGVWSGTSSFTTRLEPVADFSAESFSFAMTGNASDSAVLEISNIGTGNLNWMIETDQLETAASHSGRDSHVPALDEVLDVPNFSVTGASGGGPVVDFDIPGGLNTTGTVIGFTFEGTVSGIGSTSDWASDMRMVITSPDGVSFDVGGFTSPANDWDFQGSGSAGDGTYASTHIPAFGAEGTSDAGDWQLSFRHGWNSASAGTMNWSDVTITLHKQPPPFCGDELTAVPWMSVSPSSGATAAGDTDEVLIDIDTTGLANGDYTGYLCVSTNDPAAGMVAIPVELNISGTAPEFPVADVSPDQFSFVLNQGSSSGDELVIGNTGNADLVWTIDTANQATGYRHHPLFKDTVPSPQGFDRRAGVEPQGQAARRVDGMILGGPISSDWSEGFDDVDSLAAAGWSQINNSDPTGTTIWYQGNTESFDAHAGNSDSYVAANFNNTADAGTISNWLLTPEIELHNGTEIRFWTRTSTGSSWADRLEVRLSSEGGSDDVGSTAMDVGDFVQLLLTVNEGLTVGVYPETWTEYVIEIDELPASTSGRIGLRYFVTDAGPEGTNSNYIGIDSFSVTQPDGGPMPPTGCDNPTTISWLSLDRDNGTTLFNDSPEVVNVTVDSQGMAAGNYGAVICVNTNDPEAERIEVPVLLEVLPVDAVFQDRFEALD